MQIKSLLAVIMILIAACSIAQSDKQDTQVIQSEISKLSAEIVEVKKNIASSNDYVEDKFKVVEMTSAGISNQISAASLVAAFFSVVFTIFVFIIGLFIARIQRKTEAAEERAEKARSDAEKILEKANATKASVDETYSLIENNIQKLYEKIKREETDYLINRLRKEPRDILNLFSALTTRKLNKDDYKYLKECFLSLASGSNGLKKEECCDLILLLVFQHFPARAISDDELYFEIKSRYGYLFNSMFNNDIESIIYDSVDSASEDISTNKDKLLELISELKLHRPDLIDLIKSYVSSVVLRNAQKLELEKILKEVI